MSTESAEAPAATGRLTKFLLYGASRTIVEGMVGVRGLVVALVLGPEAFGVWAFFRLLCRYGTLLNLGIGLGVEVEVARARTGEDADEEGRRWGRAATSYIWLVFGSLSIVLGIASFLVESPEVALTLRALAGGLLLDRLWNYSKTYLRMVAPLRRYAVAELCQAFLQLTISSLGAWLWGLPGAFGGFLLAESIAVLLVVKEVPFRPQFARKRLRRLISVGLPLISLTVLVLGLTTVDRFAVLAIGGASLLGSYSFAVAVAGLSSSLAWSIRTVVVPEVYAGSRGDSALNARQHLEGTVRPFSLLYPLLLGGVAIVLGPFIYHFAPDYRDAVPVAQLFVFGGVTAGLHGLAVLPVVAAGRERAIPAVAAGTFVANGIFAGIAVASGWGGGIVATGAIAARTLLAGATLRLANGVTGTPRPGRATLRLLRPFVWCILAVSLIRWFIDGNEPLDVLQALGLYLVAIAPWAPSVLRQVRRARAAHT